MQLFHLNSVSDDPNLDFTFDGFSFTQGEALFGGDGGAIEIENGNLIIRNSEFTNNFSSDNGGALDIDEGTLLIVNSSFSNNNAADDGGAIATQSNSVKDQNETISSICFKM